MAELQVQVQATVPRCVLLDVNGTLFPPSEASGAFVEMGLQASDVEPWFAAVLRDAFAAQLSGNFEPFRSFAGYHLHALLSAAGINDIRAEEATRRVVAAWQDGQAFPDVAPGIRALHAAGVQVAVLTNGSEAIARGVLTRAGVLDLVNPLLDIGMAHAWKPARGAYEYAAKQLGLHVSEVMMVAAHPWDIQGAMQAGLQGAYVQRSPHQPYPNFFPRRPELEVTSFEELASRLGAAN